MATNEDLSEEIEQLVRRAEQDPRTHTFARLADLYRKTGESERALEVVEGGLKHHPHYLNARIVHARVLSALGRTLEARGAFERVLQIDSENLVAQAALAELGVELPPAGGSSTPATGSSASLGGAGWLARLDADWQETRIANEDGHAAEIEPSPEPDLPSAETSEAETAETELETATLAALYVRQGLFDRAIAIYERLLARDPYNARLASALEDARRRTDRSEAEEVVVESTPFSFPTPAAEELAGPERPAGDRRRPDVAQRSEDAAAADRKPDSMRTQLGSILDGEADGQSPDAPGRWPEWLVRLGRESG